jgi:hypothetical protein
VLLCAATPLRERRCGRTQTPLFVLPQRFYSLHRMEADFISEQCVIMAAVRACLGGLPVYGRCKHSMTFAKGSGSLWHGGARVPLRQRFWCSDPFYVDSVTVLIV